MKLWVPRFPTVSHSIRDVFRVKITRILSLSLIGTIVLSAVTIPTRAADGLFIGQSKLFTNEVTSYEQDSAEPSVGRRWRGEGPPPPQALTQELGA
jgi:hypothetical protein